MEVHVNNQPVKVSDNCALQLLLEQCGIAETKGIAVAVNNSVKPRSDWRNFTLQPNDKITIIRATQGG